MQHGQKPESSDLYRHLSRYSAGGMYPMHMPGHKRNPQFFMENPYLLDVTEVEGMDNLHHPEGILREQMDRMKQRYGTKESWLLVGGSTCGVLTAVSACCQRGDTVLVDRGCHRSVYHALCLLSLTPVYLIPQTDPETGISLGISVDEVAGKMEQILSAGQAVSAVILTSPTYEGIVSDIREIAKIAHKNEIPLIVDEAHGAHLSWAREQVEGMPESAIDGGADLVVQSLHKTLPALTQTAALHLCSELVSKEMVSRYLDLYETSSPSYVLMASAGQCMDYLEKEGKRAFRQYDVLLRRFRQSAAGWRRFQLWEHPRKEPSKLVICTKNSGLTGPQLAKRLRDQYKIEIEMAAPYYILAMTSVADREEGFVRFADALGKIDGDCPAAPPVPCRTASVPEPVIRMGAYEAMNHDYTVLPREQCIGRISAEYAMFYPPGVPFLVPGEEITGAAVQAIAMAGQTHLQLLGMTDTNGRTIRVLTHKQHPGSLHPKTVRTPGNPG